MLSPIGFGVRRLCSAAVLPSRGVTLYRLAIITQVLPEVGQLFYQFSPQTVNFTNGMIRNISPGEPEENLKKTLSRAVSNRVIERTCRGVYLLYTRANSVNAYRLEFVASLGAQRISRTC